MSVFDTLPAVASLETLDVATLRDILIPQARPVLFKGAINHWPAVLAAKSSVDVICHYIARCDNGKPTTVLSANANTNGDFFYSPDMYEFNFNRHEKPIGQALNDLMALQSHPHPPFTYIQSTPLDAYLPGFAAQNRLAVLPETVVPRIWISNETRAQTHNDYSYNLACVVAGKRRFTLFPPEQLKNLYIGPLDRTPSGRAISLASLEKPDFETFPRLREALKHGQVAEMEAGDVLYVPKFWWHHVQSLSRFNVLVNYWWEENLHAYENPHTMFLMGLMGLKNASDAEKSYWKSVFDHYIFQTDGDPVAHIPKRLQSALGAPTAQTRAELIKAIMSELKGV